MAHTSRRKLLADDEDQTQENTAETTSAPDSEPHRQRANTAAAFQPEASAVEESSRQKPAKKSAKKSEEKQAPKKVNFTVLLPPDLHEKFKALAFINKESMNAMVVEDITKRVTEMDSILGAIVRRQKKTDTD